METPKRTYKAGDIVIIRANKFLEKKHTDKLSELFPDARDIIVLYAGMDIEFVSAPAKTQIEEQPAEPAHPLREEFDSMMLHQRAHFGTFEAYCQMREKLDEPDDEPIKVKWMKAADLTEEQIQLNMGQYEDTYAINVNDLTEEQKGK